MIVAGVFGMYEKANLIEEMLNAEVIIYTLTFVGGFAFLAQFIFIHGTCITHNHGKFVLFGYSMVIYSYIYSFIF